MSKAKKCDRCGKYYDPYKNEILLAKGALQNIIDLCPECEKKVDRLVVRWRDHRKAKTYSKCNLEELRSGGGYVKSA